MRFSRQWGQCGSNDWNIGCHTWANSSLYVFRTEAVMLSGPVDFRALRCPNAWATCTPDICTLSSGCTMTDLRMSVYLSSVPETANLMNKGFNSTADASSSVVMKGLCCLLTITAFSKRFYPKQLTSVNTHIDTPTAESTRQGDIRSS